MTMRVKGEIKVCNGNLAAAYGALVCKPDVISAYPVTPASAVVENLARFVAEGLLDAEFVTAEGENSVMGVLVGASAAGARVFSATSGPGLQFMHDGYLMAGRRGLPIVMAIISREDSPGGVTSGEQDVMGPLDAGWILIHVESCQQILDSIIMAYKLAEDPEILRPVAVCYDGWYLSYLNEAVDIPPQDEVLRFAPPLSHLRGYLDPDHRLCLSPFFTPEELAEVRRQQLAAMEKTKKKIDAIDKDFENTFGRSYGGQVDEYRMEDAEIVLVTLGSCTGTARVAVDHKRDEGIKAGLVKIQLFRPFPKEKLAQAAKGRKAIGVLDRSVCFGWDCGHIFMELKAALHGSKVEAPLVNFIHGLGGADITIEHISRAIDLTYQASQGRAVKEVTWLALE